MPTAHTRLVALLGDPVAHSRSPALHNAAFRALGIDAVYLACRVEAAGGPAAVAAAVAAALDGLGALGALGANVTIPHKETAARHLARTGTLTPTARAIGAVNTIVRLGDGSLEGDNTDADGFLDGLFGDPPASAAAPRPAPVRAADLDGTEVVVFGAGGAARAVVVALLGRIAPARLTLVARDRARADAFARSLGPLDPSGALQTLAGGGGDGSTPGAAPGTASAPVREAVRRAALVVNATPLGMSPLRHRTPHADADDFHAGQTVYDLVYAPTETRLLREASARGATALGGLPMLAGQADRAFQRWTGRAIPPDVLHAWAAAIPT